MNLSSQNLDSVTNRRYNISEITLYEKASPDLTSSCSTSGKIYYVLGKQKVKLYFQILVKFRR